MWRGEARAGERGAATRGGERGEGGARGSSICVLPAMPRTSEALPPVYRRAELELNFPSSAEARGDGTDDAHLTTFVSVVCALAAVVQQVAWAHQKG